MSKKQLEIKADFNKFKVGLTNRIINNYENTSERQQAINKINDITIEQAINNNVICKEIFPILWDALPPQNEKNYCYDSQTIFVRIICDINSSKDINSTNNKNDTNSSNNKNSSKDINNKKDTNNKNNTNIELKVRSYFHGNLKGNPIKGCFLQSEINDAVNNINNAIKEAACREVLEESNIKLLFIDDNSCSLNIYDNIIIANYQITTNNDKHTITIKLSSDKYELLKQIFNNNLEKHKTFMENTGEISGIIL
jgi:hypothetical protein